MHGIGVVDPGAEPGGSTKIRFVNFGGAELALDTRNKDVAFAGHDTALIGSTTQMLTITLHLLLQTTTSISLQAKKKLRNSNTAMEIAE